MIISLSANTYSVQQLPFPGEKKKMFIKSTKINKLCKNSLPLFLPDANNAQNEKPLPFAIWLVFFLNLLTIFNGRDDKE